MFRDHAWLTSVYLVYFAYHDALSSVYWIDGESTLHLAPMHCHSYYIWINKYEYYTINIIKLIMYITCPRVGHLIIDLSFANESFLLIRCVYNFSSWHVNGLIIDRFKQRFIEDARGVISDVSFARGVEAIICGFLESIISSCGAYILCRLYITLVTRMIICTHKC